MSTFKLVVVTPDKVVFDGEVDRLIARTTSGDIGILKGHANYVAPLSIGAIRLLNGESERVAAVAGGLVKVDKEKTTVLTSACEWSDEIDIERAKVALERAKKYLETPTEHHPEEIAALKLRRALNRIDIAGE